MGSQASTISADTNQSAATISRAQKLSARVTRCQAHKLKRQRHRGRSAAPLSINTGTQEHTREFAVWLRGYIQAPQHPTWIQALLMLGWAREDLRTFLSSETKAETIEIQLYENATGTADLCFQLLLAMALSPLYGFAQTANLSRRKARSRYGNSSALTADLCAGLSLWLQQMQKWVQRARGARNGDAKEQSRLDLFARDQFDASMHWTQLSITLEMALESAGSNSGTVENTFNRMVVCTNNALRILRDCQAVDLAKCAQDTNLANLFVERWSSSPAYGPWQLFRSSSNVPRLMLQLLCPRHTALTELNCRELLKTYFTIAALRGPNLFALGGRLLRSRDMYLEVHDSNWLLWVLKTVWTRQDIAMGTTREEIALQGPPTLGTAGLHWFDVRENVRRDINFVEEDGLLDLQIRNWLKENGRALARLSELSRVCQDSVFSNPARQQSQPIDYKDAMMFANEVWRMWTHWTKHDRDVQRCVAQHIASKSLKLSAILSGLHVFLPDPLIHIVSEYASGWNFAWLDAPAHVYAVRPHFRLLSL